MISPITISKSPRITVSTHLSYRFSYLQQTFSGFAQYTALLETKTLFLQNLETFHKVIMPRDNLHLICIHFVEGRDPLLFTDPYMVYFWKFLYVILLFHFIFSDLRLFHCYKRFPLPPPFEITTSTPRPLTYSECFAAFSISRIANTRSLVPNAHPFFRIMFCCTLIVPPPFFPINNGFCKLPPSISSKKEK